MAADIVAVEIGPVRDMPYPTPENPDQQLPGVIVKEVSGERFIGFTMTKDQGALLASAQQGTKLGDRPMTHDLLSGIIEALGAEFQRITITARQGNSVLAELTLRSATGSLVTVDSRPSDALILGAKHQVPIFAKTELLTAA